MHGLPRGTRLKRSSSTTLHSLSHRPYRSLSIIRTFLPGVVQELDQAGAGVMAIHSIAIWNRALDNIYDGFTAGDPTLSPPLYSSADVDKFAELLEADLNRFEKYHHGVYLGFTKLRRFTVSI
jgi:hypothetical protein